ncbi:MAG: hypothetical protein DBW80_01565 [Bacteroidetes bacterium]|nr:MAG: hypothetical protein DBW80_01565 [Bacteroidota bacterium]
MNRVFFGHHKCASTWMTKIFYGIQKATGYRIKYGFDLSCELNVFGNSKRKYADEYEKFKGIHLIRDPRDIVISGYFSHLKTHPLMGWDRLIEHRKVLKKVSFSEGVIAEIDWLEPYFEDMYNWNYQNDNILELRFEDVTTQDDLTYILDFLQLKSSNFSDKAQFEIWRILNKLNNRGFFPIRNSDIRITKKEFSRLIQKNSFKNLSKGRGKGEVDSNSHYRKGTTGQWKESFDEETKDYFKKKYNHLLLKTGYEKNADW